MIGEQGGVVVSRWAHNSKVGGSKPLSATFSSYFIFLSYRTYIRIIDQRGGR